MRKKGFVPDASVSILLTVPEGTGHASAAKAFAAAEASTSQVLVFNPQEETLTIALVRELIAHTGFARGDHEPQMLVVCAAHTAGVPAQNALLKIVEEPPANTQLVLVAQPGHALLPTLISRCREILWTDTGEGETALKQQSAELAAADQQLADFLARPAAFSYHQLILLAQQLKDGATAKQVLRNALIRHSHDSGTPLPVPVAQAVLDALSALEKNGNVRLTLEHYFFAMRAAGSAQNR